MNTNRPNLKNRSSPFHFLIDPELQKYPIRFNNHSSLLHSRIMYYGLFFHSFFVSVSELWIMKSVLEVYGLWNIENSKSVHEIWIMVFYICFLWLMLHIEFIFKLGTAYQILWYTVPDVPKWTYPHVPDTSILANPVPVPERTAI